MATTPEDALGMSDEEFMKLAEPGGNPIPPAPANEEIQTEAEEEANESEQQEEALQEEESESEEKFEEEVTEETVEEEKSTETEKPSEEKKPDEEQKKEESKEAPKTTATEPKTTETTVDYKAFHDEIMKPFKANGKTIELRDSSEAIKLMQMGANYTRKMQDLQPSIKVVTMLQNAGLLDESKVDYLISLDKKDPEAIKKLISESGIDPLEIDTNVKPNFVGGSHIVSDKQVRFSSVLDDITAQDNGREFVAEVSKYDEKSQEMLWEHPEALKALHEQKQSGVYDLISSEVDRLRTLGKIDANVPFIDAYKTVGDYMMNEVAEAEKAKGALKSATDTSKPPVVEQEKAKEPVATTTATPKAAVDNNDKAAAASNTRTNAKTVNTTPNYLAMSDEDFLKQMDGRL